MPGLKSKQETKFSRTAMNIVPHFESKDPAPQKVMRFGNIMEAKVTPLTQNYILNTNAARSLVAASVRANVSIHFHFMQNTI